MSNGTPVFVAISRPVDNPTAIVILVDRPYEDSLLTEIKDAITKPEETVLVQVRTNRKSKPDEEDCWGPWRNVYEENTDIWLRRQERMPDTVQIRELIVKGVLS